MSKKQWEKIINFFLCLVIFFLPWQTRLILREGELNNGFWEYGTYSLYFLDFLMIIVIILGLDYFDKFKLKGFSLKKNYLFIFGLAFILWSALSLLWSINRQLSLYYFLRLFLAISFFLVISLIKVDWRKISFAFIFAGLIQSLLAFWQFFSQKFFSSKILGIAFQTAGRLGSSVIELANTRWLRAYGSFPHPNILAAFLLTVIFFDFYLIIKEKSKIAFYLLPLFIFALLITFSRASILVLIFILLLWICLSFIFKELTDLRKIAIFSLIIIFIFSSLLAPFLIVRLKGQERVELISLKERINQFYLAKNLIKKFFFLGSGLGTFTFAFYLFQPNFPNWYYQPVHNIYLLIWQELGIIGFFLFFLFLVIAFVYAFKNKLKKEGVFIFSLFLSLLIIGLFDHFLWTINCTLVLWWLIFALLWQTLDKGIVDE